MEPVENFGDQALHAGNYAWENVNFHRRADIVKELPKTYKTVRVASDVDNSSLRTILQSPGKLATQRRTPAQAP